MSQKPPERLILQFGEDAVKERITRNWFQKFSSSDENLEDAHIFSRPVLLTNDELRKVVESDSI